MKRVGILLSAMLLFSAPGGTACSSSVRPQTYERAPLVPAKSSASLDVPYVPTPSNVVAKMLEMAKVGPNDLVYDLGCGDGRLVVTAAKKGARGVGVDLNPARIGESNENAKKAKVADRVTFLQQDLFETDFSEATVLTMYLLPTVNLKLRPKILSKLKPGSRVVSHDFDMGEWQPDDKAMVGSARIYYWVVPANVSGTWELNLPPGDTQRPGRYSIIIDQNFQKIEGIASTGFSQVLLKDARLNGDTLEFTIEQRIHGKLAAMKFEGRVAGDSIEGSTRATLGNKRDVRESWSAKREPGTAMPIDESPDEKRYALKMVTQLKSAATR